MVTDSRSIEEVGWLEGASSEARAQREEVHAFQVQRAPCRIVCINGTIHYDQPSVLRTVPYLVDHSTALHFLKNSWPLLKISEIHREEL